MIFRLFKRKSGRSAFTGPPGSRAYAIGDVHGRLDLLRDLLAAIERDNAARGPAKTYLVMLGDLVDRGPDSRGVIEHLISSPPPLGRAIYLKGNHEEFFHDVLSGNEAAAADWLGHGGYECAESYGVSKGWSMNATPAAVVERLAAAVPQAHKDFLAAMADSFRFGDYLFVHAGIRPGVALDRQTAKDLRWIRDGFVDDLSDHGVCVVHGHTIVDGIEERANRIGIDTGAYRTGILSAVGLEGTERWFLEARDRAGEAA